MRHLRISIALLCTLFFVAGCATQPGKPLPDLTFSKIQGGPIYTAEYAVIPAPSHLIGRQPKDFVTDPAVDVYNFFSHRYRAAGTQGKFAISIMNVSVDHDVEKSQNSMGAFLNVAKKDRYTTQVTVRLQTYGVHGYETQKIDLNAKATVSISEHVSLAERESLQKESVYDLILQLERAAQKALQQELRISSPSY